MKSYKMAVQHKKYNFKTEPFDHQKKIFEETWRKPYHAFFMEMGTGKSKIAIDTMGALYLAGKIENVLIVAPKGVMDNWAYKEIPTHLSDQVPASILRWQSAIGKKLREDFINTMKLTDRLRIMVMNVEAFSTSKGASAAEWFVRHPGGTMMIVDESTTIKNRTAKRTKTIIKIGRHCQYRRILTGSPVTKSPLDLFTQAEFLQPNCLGFNSFFAFRARYAVLAQRAMGHRSFQQLVGYKRLDELNEKIQEFSSRVLKEDCLDLPEKIFLRRTVALTKEQQKAYTQMKSMALATLEDGSMATTTNVLTQIMRLQQICCGHFKNDEGHIIDLENNRIDELLNICEETDGKVIIWANWVHDIVKIGEALAIKYGQKAVQSYYGSTEQSTRQNVVEEFQKPDSPLRFFIGNTQTGGFGLTLTEAKTVIYYSNSYDLEKRMQSEDRAHRIGQFSPVTYVDLVVPKSIDEKILVALRDKIDIASQVLGEDSKKWFD